MRKSLVAAAVALLVTAGSARADTLPVLGIPAGYTPGTPFTFEVFAPGLNGLTDYTLDFTVTAGSPPSPPDLTVSAAPPAGLVGYPFPDASNFTFARADGGNPNVLSITVSDSTSGAAATTTAGVNDHLATVTISPGVNLSGPITIQFTNAEFSTARDLTFDLPPAFTIDQVTTQPPPASVPAPAGWVLLGLGGLGVAVVRKRFARTPA